MPSTVGCRFSLRAEGAKNLDSRSPRILWKPDPRYEWCEIFSVGKVGLAEWWDLRQAFRCSANFIPTSPDKHVKLPCAIALLPRFGCLARLPRTRRMDRETCRTMTIVVYAASYASCSLPFCAELISSEKAIGHFIDIGNRRYRLIYRFMSSIS